MFECVLYRTAEAVRGIMRQLAFSRRTMAFAIAIVAAEGLVGVSAVQARDFFSALFGGFASAPAPSVQMPFATEFGDVPPPPAKRVNIYGGSTAFCVRTCDGRYFPVTASDGQSRAETCKSFCPASETKIFHGSSIDNASSDNGKAYSELPNAFRYRNEIVSGCTCNGKNSAGLAHIKIEDDPTLRKGDMVAGPNGLMVAGNSRRSASLNFTPAPPSVRARFERVPVVAAQ